MARLAHTTIWRRRLVVALAFAGVVAASLQPAVGTGATSGTVVGATVPSAISLQDGCTHAAARSFGSVLPGSNSTTATGANVCRYSFTSSNSSSMLRLYQADRATQAMVGRPTSWTQRSIGSASIDLSHAGPTLMLAQNPWSVNGDYARSTDGGATWTPFAPGGGGTTYIAAVSTTTAWRFGPGRVVRSTTMQDPTPAWTAVNVNLQGGGVVDPLAADAVSSTVAWATGYAGAFRTGDAGATNWSVAGTAGCINPTRLDAVSSSTAFAVGWGRICRSTDSNLSWVDLPTGLPAGFAAGDVQASPQTATTVWAVGSGGRVVRSVDNGTNWTPTTATPIPVDLITLDVVSDSEAYVGGWDGLVFRTTDSGASWNRVRVPITGATNRLAAPGGTNVTVATEAGAVAATVDGGTSWVYPYGEGDAYRDLDAVDTSASSLPSRTAASRSPPTRARRCR